MLSVLQMSFKVVVRCLRDLESLAHVLKTKRSNFLNEPLTHMVGCMVNYVTKVFVVLFYARYRFYIL